MRIFLVILSIFSFHIGMCSSNESLFEESNNLFSQSKFNEAIESYKSLLNKDVSHSILYYNIGNCYYRLDGLAQSILYYEKALLYDPRNIDIKHNIDVVNSKLVDEIKPVPDFFFIALYSSIIDYFSPSQWSVCLLVTLYIIFSLLLLFTFINSHSIKVNILRCFIILVPVFMLTVLFLISSSSSNRMNYGILMNSNTYVKSSPSNLSTDYFIIHEGVKFEVIDQIDNWSRIRLADGKDGWVENTSFRMIDL